MAVTRYSAPSVYFDTAQRSKRTGKLGERWRSDVTCIGDGTEEGVVISVTAASHEASAADAI